ncbi:MAG: ABC transporter ATP-binding protein [Dehalococcoidia bacterium]|nr:ABC transporter ATP-binding protein [Dehalococcoidia bacterium]
MRILVRLLQFTFPYKRLVALTVGSMIGASLFALAVPTIVGQTLDTALKAQRDGHIAWQPLLRAALLILGAAGMRGLFAFTQQYFGENLSQSVAYSIRNAIYNNLQRLSFAYHDQAQIGQIMSRATQDVEGVRMYINFGIVRVGYIIILLGVALYLMVSSNLTLAMVSWGFLPIIAFVSTVMSMRLRPLWLAVQDSQGRLSTALQESLSGIRVVKAFSREEFESQKFDVEANNQFTWSYATNRIQAINQPMLTALNAAALVATIWVGGREVAHGALTTGQLTAFLGYLYLLAQPVRMLGMIANILSRTVSAGGRIFELLDAESAITEKPNAVALPRAEGRVEFDHVAFGYKAAHPIVRDVNLVAEPGQIFALVGPTGSGKSTLVNLMPRFYDVTAGAVRVDGIDVRDATISSLRRNIGIVQQDVFLFIDTIRANIRYGRQGATDEEVEEAAKAARIHDFILTMPDGYDTWVGERGVTLSGGQKQRISIARTLLMDPAILIFDDSTSSVDMETEYLIQQALAELMRGRTTFVIAQRLRTVKSADAILVLDRGEIVERGTHDELIKTGGLYQKIYELELRDQEEAFRGPAATAVAGL